MAFPRPTKSRSIFAARAIAVALAPAFVACSAIIGTRDILFDADGGPGDDAGVHADAPADDAKASNDGKASSDAAQDAAKDAGSDVVTTCQANFDNDPKNCGRCAHDCLGGACTGGACQPFAVVSTGSPRWVRVDATNIYYTDSSLEAVRKLPKAGGLPTLVCNSLGAGTETLQIDATHAYFSFDTPADGGAVGAIAQCPLAGGTATLLAPSETLPRDLLIDGTTLFWIDLASNGGANSVRRMPVTGGAVTTVTHGTAGADNSLGIGGGYLFIANDTANGTLVRCPLTGACAAPLTIASNPDGIDVVAMDGPSLYWGLGVVPGTIFVGLPDGSGATALTAAAEVPHTFAFDASYLYWLNAGPRNSATGDSDQGSLMRCPRVGGAVNCGATGPERVASPYLFVHGLVSDTDALYWVESGAIWRLAK